MEWESLIVKTGYRPLKRLVTMNTSNEHAHQPAAAVNNNCYDDRKQSESAQFYQWHLQGNKEDLNQCICLQQNCLHLTVDLTTWVLIVFSQWEAAILKHNQHLKSVLQQILIWGWHNSMKACQYSGYNFIRISTKTDLNKTFSDVISSFRMLSLLLNLTVEHSRPQHTG